MRETDDTTVGLDADVQPLHFCEQRVEHRARPVRVGKQLAVFFLVHRDAKRLEERRRALGWKRPQHVAHHACRSAPEVTFGDDAVGDVAA